MASVYSHSLLKELCSVVSSTQYAAMVSSYADLRRRKKLEVDKKYVHDRSFCRVSKSIKDDSFCVINNKDVVNDAFLYYLNLVIDSFLGRVFLGGTPGVYHTEGPVYLKSLREIPISLPGDDIIKAGADLKKNVIIILSVIEEDKSRFNEHYVEAIKSVLNEICDDFVMELYSKPFFESSDVHIIESWQDILNNCSFSKNSNGAVELLNALTASDSALMTNVRRFRALLSNLSSVINSSK